MPEAERLCTLICTAVCPVSHALSIAWGRGKVYEIAVPEKLRNNEENRSAREGCLASFLETGIVETVQALEIRKKERQDEVFL